MEGWESLRNGLIVYCIKFKVGDYTGSWCDPSIRGNVEPLTYHSESNAAIECAMLNCQYNNEGYSFWVEPMEVLTPEPVLL